MKSTAASASAALLISLLSIVRIHGIRASHTSSSGSSRITTGWVRTAALPSVHRRDNNYYYDNYRNGKRRNILDSLPSIRGGAFDEDYDDEEDDDYDNDNDDEYDEDEESELEVDNLSLDPFLNDDDNEMMHSSRLEQDESDSDADIPMDANESERDNESSDAITTTTATANNPPVKLTISTNLSSPHSILDQKLEFTASRKRSILSIKQAISKTMVGRPYLGCGGELLGRHLILRYNGQVLEDGDLIEEVVAGLEEDDDEEEHEEGGSDSDNEEDDEDDDDIVKLKFTLDILPPMDSKFGIEFMEKVNKLSTQELVDAYCMNVAGMVYGQEMILKEQEALDKLSNGNIGDDDGDEEQQDQQQMRQQQHSFTIRKNAAIIKKQLLNTFSPEAIQLMQEEHMRVKDYLQNNGNGNGNGNGGGGATATASIGSVYGLVSKDTAARHHRRGSSHGRALKGGATMNIKRSLQRNMNVNWADTTRNSLLFLFFGYFGGRNSFSRTFLLLSSPLCFVLQTRPIKVAMKQLFYTIGEPPGILLSLLPAPQQSIMSLDYGGAMTGLYGEKVLEGEEWAELMMMEKKNANAAGASRSGAVVGPSRSSGGGGMGVARKFMNDDDDDLVDYDDDDDDDETEYDLDDNDDDEY